MSAWRKEKSELRATPEACAIAVVYENLAARDLAIQLCDALAQKFIEDLEFDITWWRFDYLHEPRIAEEAAAAAAKADLILVCLDGDEVPREVKAWFERWSSRREVAEGALAVARTSVKSEQPGAADAYLRLAARRANLDYLPFPGSESAARLVDRLREDEISSDSAGLDQSPDHPYRSSGWGINE